MSVCPNCLQEKPLLATRCPHCIQEVPVGEQIQTDIVFFGVQILGGIVFLFLLWLFFG